MGRLKVDSNTCRHYTPLETAPAIGCGVYVPLFVQRPLG